MDIVPVAKDVGPNYDIFPPGFWGNIPPPVFSPRITRPHQAVMGYLTRGAALSLMAKAACCRRAQCVCIACCGGQSAPGGQPRLRRNDLSVLCGAVSQFQSSRHRWSFILFHLRSPMSYPVHPQRIHVFILPPSLRGTPTPISIPPAPMPIRIGIPTPFLIFIHIVILLMYGLRIRF